MPTFTVDMHQPSMKILEAMRGYLQGLIDNLSRAMSWLERLISAENQWKKEAALDQDQQRIRELRLWAEEAACNLKFYYNEIARHLSSFPELMLALNIPIQRVNADYGMLLRNKGLADGSLIKISGSVSDPKCQTA
ncbi:MAG TPA: hypothetical protein P5328_01660 [Candidatus Paceibacterota bacterium]|nr:hypothetical protein [Candidatus Paceibacterota bacterium]HRZ34661.1 hypothetical protein [Candidatus Paceibacterota bacterium]